MRTVRTIIRFLFDGIGSVLIVFGMVNAGFEAAEKHEFYLAHFLEITFGFFLVFTGELIAGKTAKKSN